MIGRRFFTNKRSEERVGFQVSGRAMRLLKVSSRVWRVWGSVIFWRSLVVM